MVGPRDESGYPADDILSLGFIASHAALVEQSSPLADLDPAAHDALFLAGKVVIDATNDVQGAGKLHARGAHRRRPPRPRLQHPRLGEPRPVVDGVQADLFYAVEEGHAKEVADRLITDVGLRPVWLGGVEAFDLVDSLTRLWFTLALRRGHGRRLAFKMLVGQ